MDPLFPPQPVQPIGNAFSKKKQISAETTDTKVKGFFLEKIGEARVESRGALLPSAVAPRVMIDLLSAFAIPPIAEERRASTFALMPFPRRKKQLRLRNAYRKLPPIGLRRCKPYEWINAWIQFLLFLPSVPELFSFVSRSFNPFREFAEQYAWDQLENREVSFADGATLARCLLRTLPLHCFENVDLYEILDLFAETAFPETSFYPAILFHPEWHFLLDEKENLFQKKLRNHPPEILIAFRGGKSHFLLKKQISNGCWYDLNAFIERRPDGLSGASYIAYMKVAGTWYQCDDDRITPLLSTTLNIPLRRAVLLHYKKLPF